MFTQLVMIPETPMLTLEAEHIRLDSPLPSSRLFKQPSLLDFKQPDPNSPYLSSRPTAARHQSQDLLVAPKTEENRYRTESGGYRNESSSYSLSSILTLAMSFSRRAMKKRKTPYSGESSKILLVKRFF